MHVESTQYYTDVICHQQCSPPISEFHDEHAASASVYRPPGSGTLETCSFYEVLLRSVKGRQCPPKRMVQILSLAGRVKLWTRILRAQLASSIVHLNDVRSLSHSTMLAADASIRIPRGALSGTRE